MRPFKTGLCTALSALTLCWVASRPAMAASDDTTSSADTGLSVPELKEVVVTARYRKENLQEVPDAITVFTPAVIANAGIQQLSDFTALVPNLTLSDGSGFRAGGFVLSMRGIGNSQLGWPAVSYIVDGIPEVSQDEIAIGTLLPDIQRIEVLRGPQSALYGFNAIAGAINIITEPPTREWTADARAVYGNGDNRQIDGIVSGPLGSDKLLSRLGVSYLDNDGLIRSTSNDANLDFRRHKQVQGRVLFLPTDNFRVDLHGDYIDEQDGAVYQDQVPIGDANNWSVYGARRAFPGEEVRVLSRGAARIEWDLPALSLISVSAYSHIDQKTYSSFCYDDPNDPYFAAPGGGDQCPLGFAYGNSAQPGQPIDQFYFALDNARTWIEDLRLQSRSSKEVNWTFGASWLSRNALDGFNVGDILAPDRANLTTFPLWERERNHWWGVYGQVSWNVTDRLQLTGAARYDDETYENRVFVIRCG
jgi:iron complex outermembrane recepter protein